MDAPLYIGMSWCLYDMLALHILLDMPYQRGLSSFRLYLNKSDYIFPVSTSQLKISCGYCFENALKPTYSCHEVRAMWQSHSNTQLQSQLVNGSRPCHKERWDAFPWPPRPPHWPHELPLLLPGLLARRAQCYQRLCTGQILPLDFIYLYIYKVLLSQTMNVQPINCVSCHGTASQHTEPW